MNRKVSGFTALALAVIVSFTLVISVCAYDSSDGISESDENIIVTYDYIKKLKEELKEEILEELQGGAANGNSSDTGDSDSTGENRQTYKDITLNKGQMIIFAVGSEIIYRGGNASVITSSSDKNKGVLDMSEGKELYSGQPLQYGHIYYSSDSDARKYILVTGEKAFFTVRGSYEVR